MIMTFPFERRGSKYCFVFLNLMISNFIQLLAKEKTDTTEVFNKCTGFFFVKTF